MNVNLERRARDVFLELLSLPSDERAPRLELELQQDPELGHIVADLLAEAAGGASFLEQPALGEGFRISGPYSVTGRLDTESTDGPEQHPEAIGPYRILGVIGSGGMGIVYRAQQQQPRREVALKVLKTGLPGKRARRYFEHEAEALGRLHHPGIAQIFEAGTADFGRGAVPFLAMECVNGVDLGRHVRKQAPSLRERIGLLEQVCRAVHHAHQNQVVHRDLKPGNVLVTEAGLPKVIDFGLARLGDVELSLTRGSGHLLGTLSYMSPEQVGGDPVQVDASTDVYALGATAYEVLAGRPPFELGSFTLAAAVHHVAHDEPDRLRSVVPELDPDLAAIVEQAMAREKSARYPSAAALGEDLRRWLNHEPVLARPVGRLARLAKFTRRNRLAVGSACAVLLALLAGIVGTTWQARDALAQARRAGRIQTYLQDTLRSAGEPRTDGRELTVSHILAAATPRLEDAFADDPATRADLEETLGMSSYENGYYEEAERLVRSAYGWRRAELGPDALETLAASHDLGLVLIARDRLAEAEGHLRTAYTERLALLGAEHEDTQRSANWLGHVLLQHADPREAEALFAASWDVRRRTLGSESLAALSTRARLAIAWSRQGRVSEAEQTLREILEVERRVCGATDFQLYETLNNLATLLINLGRYSEAEGLLEEALDGYVRLRGADHSDTQVAQQNLRVVQSESAEHVPQATVVNAPEKGARHYIFQITTANQRFYKGELGRAEAELRESAEALERIGGQERLVLTAQQCLASVLSEVGQLAEAIALQQHVVETHARAGTQDNQQALAAATALAESLRRAGRLDEARAVVEQAYSTLKQDAGEQALYTLSARATLAAVLADLGRLDEAHGHAAGALATIEDTLDDPNQYTEAFRVRYGRILTLRSSYEEAERELLLAHARLLELHTRRGPYTVRATKALVALYEAWGRDDEATHWRGAETQSTVHALEASAPAAR